MNLRSIFPPKPSIEAGDLRKGMRTLVMDGVCSQIMGVFTTGAFLAAYAVLLGASNKVIGLIAAVGPLTQTLQIPAIYLINRAGSRRGVVVASSIFSRMFWFLVAALPFVVPEPARIPILLISLFFFFGFGAISGCAWNSWVRDLIPDRVRGTYFGKRLAVATGVGAALSLAAGMAIDHFKQLNPDYEIMAYSAIIAIGGLSGFIGILFLWNTPEPTLAPVSNVKFRELVKEPLRDPNYRALLSFLVVWSFAANFGAPFFAVYMLKRLGMDISWIIGLAVLSQAVNVAFFRVWGSAADRFANKPVLSICGALFIFGYLLWPFTAMPNVYWATIPLLIVIHLLSGVSTAGVLLCTGTISAKMAPPGRATAYLATNAFACGIAATVAPIVGGILADTWSQWQVNLTLSLSNLSTGATQMQVNTLNLQGLDFLFIGSFIFGLYGLHRLLAVKEAGEIEKGIVVKHLLSEARRSARAISNVAGLRGFTTFSYQLLQRQRRPEHHVSKHEHAPPEKPAEG